MVKKESKIAEREYYKFLERGGEHGKDMNDWLEAEREISKGKSTPKKPTAKKTAAKKTAPAKKTVRKSK